MEHRVNSGQPFIIDVHAHLGPTPTFYFPDTPLRRILSVMDHLRVEKACCTHMGFLLGQTDAALREAAQAYRESHGRILNYAAFNPNDPDASLRLCRECLELEGFIGIKIHPAGAAGRADDEAYRPAWALAAEKNVILLSHSWSTSAANPAQNVSVPELFEKYLREYPGVKFIFGHAGGRYRAHLKTAELVARHPNAYLDVSGDSFSLDLIEWLVGAAGADKVLYASDFTWCEPRSQLGMVLGARIGEEAKLKILRLNALRLLAEMVTC